MFKITKLIKVKAYENGHDLRTTHNTWTLTVSASIGCLQTHFFDIFVIFFAKIINNTENICNFVLGNLHNYYCLNLCNYLAYNYKDNKIMRDYQTFKTLFLSRTQVYYFMCLGAIYFMRSAQFYAIAIFVTGRLCRGWCWGDEGSRQACS